MSKVKYRGVDNHPWLFKLIVIVYTGFEFEGWVFQIVLIPVCNTSNSFDCLPIRYRFLRFSFHFFLSQISIFIIKSPSSRLFVILSHDNSDADIFMTQVSSTRPLRWPFFPRNYPSVFPLPQAIPESLKTTDIFPHCTIAFPLKRTSFTLNSGNKYGECTRLGPASITVGSSEGVRMKVQWISR